MTFYFLCSTTSLYLQLLWEFTLDSCSCYLFILSVVIVSQKKRCRSCDYHHTDYRSAYGCCSSICHPSAVLEKLGSNSRPSSVGRTEMQPIAIDVAAKPIHPILFSIGSYWPGSFNPSNSTQNGTR